jgi:hypothetical protein
MKKDPQNIDFESLYFGGHSIDPEFFFYITYIKRDKKEHEFLL